MPIAPGRTHASPHTAGCPHFKFEGREIIISFIFNANSLYPIQLWIYEGESESEARQAIDRVVGYLEQRGGSATITGLPDTKVTGEAVMNLLNGRPVRPGTINQVALATALGDIRRNLTAGAGRDSTTLIEHCR